MTSRYDNRFIRVNAASIYNELFIRREIGIVSQYTTPRFSYPTVDESLELNIIPFVWKMGDRFYKLADHYYNDPKLWWVIAWFNKTPTESHLKIGDVVQIPLPLERV